MEKRGHQDQKERAAHIKQEFHDLSEEYINLKGNFTSLSEDHQSLVYVLKFQFVINMVSKNIVYIMFYFDGGKEFPVLNYRCDN